MEKCEHCDEEVWWTTAPPGNPAWTSDFGKACVGLGKQGELHFVSPVHLLAKIAEYEHALEHVTDDHKDTPHCPDCQSLAQSALDGVNREDFRDHVGDF